MIFYIEQEEIRNQLGRLETDLTTLNEKSSAAISQIEKYYEARREADRRLDTQYQREMYAFLLVLFAVLSSCLIQI